MVSLTPSDFGLSADLLRQGAQDIATEAVLGESMTIAESSHALRTAIALRLIAESLDEYAEALEQGIPSVLASIAEMLGETQDGVEGEEGG